MCEQNTNTNERTRVPQLCGNVRFGLNIYPIAHERTATTQKAPLTYKYIRIRITLRYIKLHTHHIALCKCTACTALRPTVRCTHAY